MSEEVSADELEAKAIGIKNALAYKGPKGSSLCYRCTRAVIFRRKSMPDHDRVIMCGTLGGPMPPDIEECSAFKRHNELDLYDMAQLAIPIDNRKLRKGGYL